ncbi:hypothetical protein EDD22DRAFT_950409 [Suillus occidentalis]|nr:hypothetical protein EDD22DRAFT_950409 [Suillus occidentalis]
MVSSLTKDEVEEATQMAAQWNKHGIPAEVQADVARRKSKDILQYVATEMFKKARMRLFMMSAWKNEEGKLMVSSHNYYNELGNGESFVKTYTELGDDLVVKKGWKDNTYKLDIGGNGFPVLPDHADLDSDTQKAIVRAFLNWHYYVTFEFYGWWSKADKEVKLPISKTSQTDLKVLENGLRDKDSGGRGKRAKRTQKKTVVAMDDTSDISDKENIRVSMSKPTRNCRKSKSWASSEELADEFKASSDGSLDNDSPAVKKSTATVKDKTHESGRRDMVSKGMTNLEVVPKEEDHPATSGWTNVFIDQSASQAPPTPLDNPRCVGPGGVLKCKPGNGKDAEMPAVSSTLGNGRHTKGALPSSPKNKVQTKGKKCPAKDDFG